MDRFCSFARSIARRVNATFLVAVAAAGIVFTGSNPGLHAESTSLSAEEFLFASRTAIDIDRSYENYRSTFDTFLPYADFRALILGEHWQPTGGGQVTVPTETGPNDVDISSTDMGFIWVLDRARRERSYIALLGALSGNTLSDNESEWEYQDGIVGLEIESENVGNLVVGQFFNRRPVVTETSDGQLVFAADESADGADTTEETQYTFLDISTHGFRAKGYGDWSSGTLALFDLSYSFVPQGLEDLLVLLGSSYFTDVESGRLYGGLTDISLSGGLSLDLVVEATGAENFDGVHDGSVALELRNRPYDWAGFNYSLAASLRIDKEAHLLPGARATLGFPRLFYNTQIELGISYDYIDVVRRIPRENTFAFLIGFNTLITDR